MYSLGTKSQRNSRGKDQRASRVLVEQMRGQETARSVVQHSQRHPTG